MKTCGSILALVAGLALAGCSDVQGPASPTTEPGFRQAGAGAANLSVMTRNLYVGTAIEPVLAALDSPDPADDFPALLAAIATLGQTAFPARAQAIADEIASVRPQVIGLQEVSEIHVNLTPLGLPIVIDQDFLPILQAALAARGLNYVVAGTVKNIEANPVPGLVSLVDYDAVLVDADHVTVGTVQAKNFDFNLGNVGGVDIKRGWIALNALIDGQAVTVLSTHLESGDAPGLSQLRWLQAQEIAAVLAAAGPAIVIGDLNDRPGSLMYQALATAGFSDVWSALRPGVAGYSCCHFADLSDKIARFDQRIDYVWARGIGHPRAGVLGQIILTGDQPSDRLPGPSYSIWPSDHAGLAARLLLPPAKGLMVE